MSKKDSVKLYFQKYWEDMLDEEGLSVITRNPNMVSFEELSPAEASLGLMIRDILAGFTNLPPEIQVTIVNDAIKQNELGRPLNLICIRTMLLITKQRELLNLDYPTDANPELDIPNDLNCSRSFHELINHLEAKMRRGYQTNNGLN